jgi:hypothetical protein
VEVESEHDLELRIGGNMSRPGMVSTALKQCAGEMVEGEDEPQRLH